MRLALILHILLIFPLSGCAPSSSMRSVLDLSQQITTSAPELQVAPSLNPDYRYLRVQTDNRASFFVLGYLDPHPDGTLEVWFSAQKEVLRLRQGRLMGVSGTATEWLNVTYAQPPAWSESLTHANYLRTRDIAPGYHFGLAESLQLQSIKAPEKSNLLGIPPESLSWFSESSTGKDGLKPTLYALRHEEDGARVVYSETCLAKELCFSWQRWPAN